MAIHVVGGVYLEHCTHPHWNEIYGSGGRAALAIATMGTPVVLHSYMNHEALQAINDAGAWCESFQANAYEVNSTVGFSYLYDMAVPDIQGTPPQPYPALRVNEEKVVRFGMLEGDAIVHAEWAVYDPQNVSSGQPYAANGSTAKHLALVLNAWEAGQMAGMPGEHPSKSAPVLAQRQNAEVVVVKMGPEGAFVSTASTTAIVPAFRTKRVWKVGSGDCFVAHFANAWMQEGRSPVDAAEIASRATAFYCETQGFPTRDSLQGVTFPPVLVSQAYHNGIRPQIYLAGPFFDLAQVWMIQQTRGHLLDMGLRVFSPYHDIGLGSAEDVVSRDLAAIESSDLLLALAYDLDTGTVYEVGYAKALRKPVVVYSERYTGERLKMMEGSGCVICDDYTTALYSTLWEAATL